MGGRRRVEVSAASRLGRLLLLAALELLVRRERAVLRVPTERQEGMGLREPMGQRAPMGRESQERA